MTIVDCLFLAGGKFCPAFIVDLMDIICFPFGDPNVCFSAVTTPCHYKGAALNDKCIKVTTCGTNFGG